MPAASSLEKKAKRSVNPSTKTTKSFLTALSFKLRQSSFEFVKEAAPSNIAVSKPPGPWMLPSWQDLLRGLHVPTLLGLPHSADLGPTEASSFPSREAPHGGYLPSGPPPPALLGFHAALAGCPPRSCIPPSSLSPGSHSSSPSTSLCGALRGPSPLPLASPFLPRLHVLPPACPLSSLTSRS